MKKLLMLLLVILIMAGCSKKEEKITQDKEVRSDEVKVIKNSSEAADPSLNISPELLYTLKGTADDGTVNFTRVQQLTVTDDGDFFVVDPGTYSIKKFDPEGKFLKSFGKQGNGPGEFSMMNTGLTVLNGKVIVPDPMKMGCQIFDLDGNFIESVNISQQSVGMIVMPTAFTKKEMIAYNTAVSQKDGKIFMNSRLSVINDSLQVVSTIWGKEQEFDPTDVSKIMSMGKEYPSYSVLDGVIYMAEPGTDKYEISVYDSQGNKQYVIKKAFRKVKYTQEELDRINENINNYTDAAAKQFMKDYKFSEEYKRAVTALYAEGPGILWVEKAFESTGDEYLRKIDIFKDGIYQNTVELKDTAGSNIKGAVQILNGRLYAVDVENNEISVYQL